LSIAVLYGLPAAGLGVVLADCRMADGAIVALERPRVLERSCSRAVRSPMTPA
jgi:hypothetical protein